MGPILLLALLLLPGSSSPAQTQQSPTDTVVAFYRALKKHQYVEGFRHSVYRGAIEGLTPDELKDLEPDFARTFSAIPDKIEPGGEQITGDTATVTVKFEGLAEPQQVALIRSSGEWLVGDQDSFDLVKAQGKAFFFNTRMIVNQGEIYETMSRSIGAELIYSRKFQGMCAPLSELIRLGALPKDVEDEKSSGYRLSLTVSEDKKSFFALATPVAYGTSGRLSFYADMNGVRAEDLKGQPASDKSPFYKPE
jgi:hypothetical protein